MLPDKLSTVWLIRPFLLLSEWQTNTPLLISKSAPFFFTWRSPLYTCRLKTSVHKNLEMSQFSSLSIPLSALTTAAETDPGGQQLASVLDALGSYLIKVCVPLLDTEPELFRAALRLPSCQVCHCFRFSNVFGVSHLIVIYFLRVISTHIWISLIRHLYFISYLNLVFEFQLKFEFIIWISSKIWI